MTGPLESSQSYYGNPRLALPQFIHPASKRKIDAIAQSGPELKHLKFNSHHQTVKSDPHKKLEERLTAIESALGFDDQSSNNIQKMQEALREAHKMLATMYIHVPFIMPKNLQTNDSIAVSSYSRSQTKAQVTWSLRWHPNRVQQQNPTFSTFASFRSLTMDIHSFSVSVEADWTRWPITISRLRFLSYVASILKIHHRDNNRLSK